MDAEEDGRADGPRLMRDLPPMPEPDLGTMRGEAAMGCTMVCMIIAACVGGAHAGVVLMDGEVQGAVPQLCLAAVYVEAVAAIGCLLGLMLSDPGVVQRSEETCLPLPPEVAASLREGKPASNFANIKDPDRMRSYCVRCYVWRSPQLSAVDDHWSCAAVCPAGEGDSTYHHCSTCQRCVAHFDHHCGFFGRCIAGKGLQGNMIYFRMIIGTGVAGAGTAGGTLVVGLMKQGDGPTYWLGVALAAYLGLCLLASLVNVIACACTMCFREMAARSPRLRKYITQGFGVTPYKYTRTESSGGMPPPQAEVVQPTVVGVADSL